jgi:hypothetical protein
MAVIKTVSKNGKSISVTSDKFEFAAQAIYDSRRQNRVASGGRYRAFNSDSPLHGYSESEIPSIMKMNQSLATSNVALAFRLWREGLLECSDFVKSTHFNQGINVRVKLPKVLDGELELDEEGRVIGGHTNGSPIHMEDE